MKLLRLLLPAFTLLFLFACSKIEDKSKDLSGNYERYFKFIKVNNDLTFSGVSELDKENLINNEYFHFFYNNNKLTKIKSHSSLANSFHELNKYIFNINKDFKDINIFYNKNSKDITFFGDKELVKFSLTYQNNLPISFQVIPFNLNYDNFGILGRSIVYSGLIKYDNNNLNSIKWDDSNAEYKFFYDKKGNLISKSIFHNGSQLYEYIYKLNDKGIVIGIK